MLVVAAPSCPELSVLSKLPPSVKVSGNQEPGARERLVLGAEEECHSTRITGGHPASCMDKSGKAVC